jgi:hypothetical protein
MAFRIAELIRIRLRVTVHSSADIMMGSRQSAGALDNKLIESGIVSEWGVSARRSQIAFARKIVKLRTTSAVLDRMAVRPCNSSAGTAVMELP